LGITGGDTIQTLIPIVENRIMICYVEFPELSRLMADQGMNIYRSFLNRHLKMDIHVKHCAHKSQNECYVAIAGCVGNLPKWIFNMHKRLFIPLILLLVTNQSRSKPKYRKLFVDVDINLLKEFTNMEV
jgi:hypothetical protein